MTGSRHVWLWLGLFVALAGGGLGWLTRQSLELDRAESWSRQQAELDERVRLALWRMDAFLMPLLVQEASRPDFAYSANHFVALLRDGQETQERVLSPILESPPPFVRLHFQLAADGQVTSPQAPQSEERSWSLQQGVAPEQLDAAQRHLEQLRAHLAYAELLRQLPELPAVTPPPTVIASAPPGAKSSELGNRQALGPTQVVESFAQQQLARFPQLLPTPPVGPPADDRSQMAPSQKQSPIQQFPPQQDGSDLSSRNTVFLAYAHKVSVDNLAALGSALVVAPVATEGVSRPLWVEGELILARRVERGGATLIQGCWLDWPALEDRLRREVADLLPDITFRPARIEDVARSLATLPVQLVPPRIQPAAPASPATRLALVAAWTGLALAAIAVGMLISSVIGLSERRAAFVAAVTHELRTPLTTLRLYAEMLARGMVPAEHQPTYHETLRGEADRLAHLVDNVLQYARLERGRGPVGRETVTVAALLERLVNRLESRAAGADLQLTVTVAPEAAGAALSIDVAALEQILFNLVDNACKYAAQGPLPTIELTVDCGPRSLVWRVRDHGPGIPARGRRRLFQPFSKTVQEAAISAPGVGLGLALSLRLARELGGGLELECSDATGSVFALTLPRVRGRGERPADGAPPDTAP